MVSVSFYFCVSFCFKQKCCWNCATLLCNRPVQSPMQQQPVLSSHFPWGACSPCLTAPRKHQTMGSWCAVALFSLVLLMGHRKDITVVSAETWVCPWRNLGLVLPIALKWVVQGYLVRLLCALPRFLLPAPTKLTPSYAVGKLQKDAEEHKQSNIWV